MWRFPLARTISGVLLIPFLAVPPAVAEGAVTPLTPTRAASLAASASPPPTPGVQHDAVAKAGREGAAPAGRKRRACRTGTVSLTFDDGPSPEVTPRLVRILKRAHVPATFFMVGQRAAAYPKTVRLVARAGFVIANHTWAHERLITRSDASIASSLRSTQRALNRAGVSLSHLMRPPYGEVNERVRGDIRRAGFVPVLWDVDSRDWEGYSTATIAAKILAQLRRGRSNIVLQHDGVRNSPASVAAVPRVIAEAKRRGYCFVALNERGKPGFPTPEATLHLPDRVKEGRKVHVRVYLDQPAPRAVRVRLVARNPLGRVVVNRRVRFTRGQRVGRLQFVVERDYRDQAPRLFHVEAESAVGVSAAKVIGDFWVDDRDRPPQVDGVSRSVPRPRASLGSRVRHVRFELRRPSDRPIRLTLRTKRGTAGADDFLTSSTTLTVRPGRTRFQVPITLLSPAAGTTNEPGEYFDVVITRAHNARIGRPARVTFR